MCGINGFNFSHKTKIAAMNKAISHRGPDGKGFYCDSKNNISLAQVRLAIVDLTNAGLQPMWYHKSCGASSQKFNSQNISKSKLNMVFNGEIYNYIEVREELKKNGYTFSTQSDSEVILAAYNCWGRECVHKFNGMWAFCIHDMKKKELFCSRDRLGVKPFYYYNQDGKFIFSSELKGILAHSDLKINRKENLSHEAIQLYFSLHFIPAPLTIYSNVFKLKAGHNIIYDLKKKCIKELYQYYTLPNFKPNKNYKLLVSRGKRLLKSATTLRMRADVPVGAFLSGGVDSSSVVGEMKTLTDSSKLHTFSIGFEGKDYDETPYINIVKNKFKTIHHHKYFKQKDFERLVNQYTQAFDEPFGDYSGFSALFVSKLAKEFVTVSLSGDGGDEIFGGYNMHLMGKRIDTMRYVPKFLRNIGSKVPAKKNLNSFISLYSLKKALELSMQDKSLFYAKLLEDERYKPKVFRKWSQENLLFALKKGDNNMSEGLRIYDLLFNSLADNFLTKVDRASMWYGLEVRSPFLDYRFAEFAQTIPNKHKVDLLNTKKLLKEMSKEVLPSEILNRSKQGFTPPIQHWILDTKYQKDLKKVVPFLEEVDYKLAQYFNSKVLLENNKVYNDDKIRLFIFAKWYEKYISE